MASNTVEKVIFLILLIVPFHWCQQPLSAKSTGKPPPRSSPTGCKLKTTSYVCNLDDASQRYRSSWRDFAATIPSTGIARLIIQNGRYDSIDTIIQESSSSPSFLPSSLASTASPLLSTLSSASTTASTPAQLVTIDLSSNGIIRIDKNSFLRVTSLVELNLSNNRLQSLECGVFDSLERVEKLVLDRNFFEFFDDCLFGKLKNLRVLSIQFNRLLFVQAGLLGGSPLLERVLLQSNDLSYISAEAMGNETRLKELNVRQNALERLQPMDALANVTSLSLGYNYWACDCGLQWLFELWKQPFVTEKDATVECFQPLDQTAWRVDEEKNFSCDSIQLEPALGSNLTVTYLSNFELHCVPNSTTETVILWETPFGNFSLPENQALLVDHTQSVASSASIKLGPAGLSATQHHVTLGRNGTSILVPKARQYFAGRYRCIAINAGGQRSVVYHVKMKSYIRVHFFWSLLVAAVCIVLAIIVGVSIGSCRRTIRTCKPTRRPRTPPIYPSPQLSRGPSRSGSDIICFSVPMPVAAAAASLGETFEQVRTKLVKGFSGSVSRARNQLHVIRNRSSAYVHSGTARLQMLRQSGQQYTVRMRNQMRLHVQSLREFCFSGSEFNHTVSLNSVNTDADSGQNHRVIRKETYV